MHDEKELSYRPYVNVWLTLLILTVVTILAADVEFGDYNLFVAMIIASVKSTYVFAYFMHLKQESKEFKLMLAINFVTFAIFIGVIFIDFPFRP